MAEKTTPVLKGVPQTLLRPLYMHYRTVSLRPVETHSEIRDRLGWIGRRWVLRGFGRLLLLFFTNSGLRGSIKKFFAALRWIPSRRSATVFSSAGNRRL